VTDSTEADRFVVDRVEPASRQTLRDGTLDARVDAAVRLLEDCHVCPRNCGGNRLHEAAGRRC
jgi:uncharacterized Fe-S radical SAM superfamily protein PflX